MRIDFNDKTVVITGAAGGIGKKMAHMFAENGAAVVIADLSENGEKVASQIRANGGKSFFVRTDIANRKDSDDLARKTVEAFGKIDVLVNNAGINVSMKDRGPIHQFPDDMWEKIVRINLNGTYYCSKAALQYMTEKKYGKIINISSVVGFVPLRDQCAFAASKAGIVNLTKAMALELAPLGINVNAIAPGSIDIPVMKTGGMYTDGRYEKIMSNIPFHRPGKPEDIGNAALFLASEEASYVTGHVLVVDGGWTCGFSRDW